MDYKLIQVEADIVDSLDRIASRLESLLDTESAKDLRIRRDCLEPECLKFMDEKSFGISLKITNLGHNNPKSAWGLYPENIDFTKIVDVDNAQDYMWHNAPAGRDDVSEMLNDDRKDEGLFWDDGKRYEKNENEYTADDFSKFCRVNKTAALGTQLKTLRRDLGQLGSIARDIKEKAISSRIRKA